MPPLSIQNQYKLAFNIKDRTAEVPDTLWDFIHKRTL